MHIVSSTLLAMSLCFSYGSALAQNACDLNQDGIVNIVDVQLAINMSNGLQPCTANIEGPGVCNSDVVARVNAAALGAPCNTHYASLNWTASASGNVVGYNVYRSRTAGGPYMKLNTSLVVGISYTDPGVIAGQTYYYVATAVDNTNAESAYSNEAVAVIPKFLAPAMKR
jgi:hypothetical protein